MSRPDLVLAEQIIDFLRSIGMKTPLHAEAAGATLRFLESKGLLSHSPSTTEPEGKRDFFTAAKIQIGACPNPDCRGVHVHLLDEAGTSCAQFVMECDEIDAVCDNLLETRDELLSGESKDRQPTMARH